MTRRSPQFTITLQLLQEYCCTVRVVSRFGSECKVSTAVKRKKKYSYHIANTNSPLSKGKSEERQINAFSSLLLFDSVQSLEKTSPHAAVHEFVQGGLLEQPLV